MKLLFNRPRKISTSRFCYLESGAEHDESKTDMSPLRELLKKLDEQGDKWSDIAVRDAAAEAAKRSAKVIKEDDLEESA